MCITRPYVAQSGKTSLITYLNVLRNASFQYLEHCSTACQQMKLRVPNFHMFYTNSLPSRASTVQVAKR